MTNQPIDVRQIHDREELLDAWQSRYPGSEGFAKDGVVDEAHFADPKILFILKDPSTDDYRGSEYDGDLRRWLTGPPRSYGSTWLNVARWAQVLLGDVDSIDKAANRNAAAQKVMRRIAAINLKKSAFNSLGENTTADRFALNAYAQRDQDFLRRQVELIAPDVILGCGIHQPLIWLLALQPDEVSRIFVEKKEGKQVHLVRDGSGGPKVILTRHPGRAPVNPSNGQSVTEELRGLWAVIE